MTVTSETSRVTYSGNGSTTVFSVPFYFIAAADLRVVRRAADGVETTLALTTNYTVSGAGNPSGGSITMAAGPAAGVSLVIYRDPANTQTADYVSGGRFPAESHERALDRVVMSVQRTRELANLSLRLRETDVSGTGRYQAGGNRISNLGTPFDPGDAVTKAYADGLGGTATAETQVARDAAIAAAAASATSATASAGSATAAAGSATSASTSAAAAAVSAANAAAAAGFDSNLFLLKSGNLSGIANYATARANLGISTVGNTGAYADLTGKPTFATVATTGAYSSLTGLPTLATVAGTGAYNDLTGKPTLGGAASLSVGTTSGTVAAGNDTRFDQSSKAPLASPALTGTPTAPTAAYGTNSTQIATTAFVIAQATASIPTTLGAVNTYAMAYVTYTNAIEGNTYAGGNMIYSGGDGAVGGSPTGTWRAMGTTGAPATPTLFVRIA